MECFDKFLTDTPYPFCWWCGRWSFDRPLEWGAPFLIERVHIVNKPRVELRSVCALLCSRCHKLEHGETFGDPKLAFVRPTTGNLIWLKMVFDPDSFDSRTLRKYSLASLPSAEMPPETVRREFERKNFYPFLEKSRP